MTLLFAVTTAGCLVVLATIAVRIDGQSREHVLDEAVTHRADGLARVVYYEDAGGLRLDGLRDDTLADSAEALGVVQAATGAAPQLREAKPGPGGLPDQAGLDEIWATVQHEQETVTVEATTADGHPFRWAVAPVWEGDRIDAAVLVGADPARSEADHTRLISWLTAGCAALVLVAAAVGHLLSGRSMRPALRGLEQQEQFLAEAAHELRTPLATLRLVVESGRSGRRPGALDEAVGLVDRLGRLVTGLLARARVEAGTQELERTPLRLDQLVEQTVEELDRAELVTVTAEAVVVEGDPELLAQAVRNLVENALRHGGGTPVEVTVDPGRVAVRDHGPGVPAADRERVFERRVTGAGSGGTGTGLAIVRWVAELHGGSAELSAAPGGGAVVELLLPERGEPGRAG
ncbi:HAMP domain-containing sensor histidine kinase [Kitasatospora sp. MMS16-BH015]|uniref:sensor histidine kinase n=1 Tax=Kitasatospora sp. MMS16-BH015 TaxID=2018025 RepID=UPI0020C4E85B|nr:HAMP domain-containing sensor histidine kinase [Kitasatospora sp. MMS16-BH015]